MEDGQAFRAGPMLAPGGVLRGDVRTLRKDASPHGPPGLPPSQAQLASPLEEACRTGCARVGPRARL